MFDVVTLCRVTFFILEELDWFTEELYFKSRAIVKRDWRLESKGLSPVAIDRGRLIETVRGVGYRLRPDSRGKKVIAIAINNNFEL